MVEEEFKKMLLNRGFSKVYIASRSSLCTVFICEYRGINYIIALYRGAHSSYAKTVPLESVPSWDCETVMYIPTGFYTFGTTVEELVEKLSKKVKAFSISKNY